MYLSDNLKHNPEAMAKFAKAEHETLQVFLKEYNDELMNCYAVRLSGKGCDVTKLGTLRNKINLCMTNIQQYAEAYAKAS